MRFALALFALSVAAQPPDLILHNGKIVTVDAKFSVRQAIAVRGTRIAAVGSNAEVLRTKGPSTQLIDLAGKTVIPGLMDSHTHAVDAAMYEFDHPVPDMLTVDDVLRYLEGRAKVTTKGEWIVLSQVFITRLREQRYPTRAELDRIAPEHPVAFRTGPDASLNSMALARSGITRAPHPSEGKGGKIERDASGEPTGILRSAAQFLKIPAATRTPTRDDRVNRLRMLLKDYNSLGITSIADRDASDEEVEVYRLAKERGLLSCRVFVNLHIEPNEAPEKVEARVKYAAAHPLHRYDGMLWLRGLKAYLDGGMLTGSAYMREPWGVSKIYSITDPSYRGLRYIEPEALYRVAKLALANELQFTAHSVGDGAVTALVDAYERVNREFPVRPARPCLTHANFMTGDVIDTMARLGIVADLQPAWLEHDGATLAKQFGDPRLRLFQPYKTLFSKGVMIGGGSDHMQKIGGMRSINRYHPFWAMWVTLTRQPRWSDRPLHPGADLA
ncbi:MAG: amidohydrolase [Bryobacteraceae bacterium]